MPQRAHSGSTAARFLLGACTICAAVGKFTEVTKLPGWSGPLPSRSWSGFVDGTPPGEELQIHTHYWFFESEGDPEKDPLIIWTNGGPGASSMFGLMVELGPFFVSDASLRTAEFNRTGVPTLYRNPYAWTRLGSLLIYNAPAPVGFSFCGDNPAGAPTSCGTWDDTRAAVSAHTVLKNFFNDFPAALDRDIYITGESYAGIYVPTLAREILHDNGPTPLRLKGLAVGDGCVGTDINCFGPNHGPYFLLKFLAGHQQFSEELYSRIRKGCSKEELKYGVKDSACAKLLDEMDEQVGGYFAYSLYDECTYENGLKRSPSAGTRSWRDVGRPLVRTRARHVGSHGPGGARAQGGALNDYPCGGGPAMDIWVNQTAVRHALGVSVNSTFYSFDNGEAFKYVSTERNLLPFYKHLAEKTDLRVLIYNGDTDPGLNTLEAQNWTRGVGLAEREAWRPWTIDGRAKIGGYVTAYEGDFSFLTVRGAGHMVPEYKPAASFEFLKRFLRNEPFQRYNP